MDFMSDVLYHGRRFRTLNILDEGVREVLDIVIDTSIPGGRVVRTLDRLVEWRDKPDAIRVDNGPEYLSEVFADWCRSHYVELRYIQPGKPNQNAYIERFNRTFRHEVLDAYIFKSLRQVREITRAWMHDYDEERPHDSLGNYRRRCSVGEPKLLKTLLLNCRIDREAYEGTQCRLPESCASSMAAGSCLLFDGRILHRGLANRSDSTRHVAYFSYRRRGYSANTHFESQRSVFDTTV